MQLGKELDEIWDLVGRQVARCYASTVKDPPTSGLGRANPAMGSYTGKRATRGADAGRGGGPRSP